MLDTRAHPRFSASGEFVGMTGANVDMTELDEAERARELLVDTRNHRKNTLSSPPRLAVALARRCSNALWLTIWMGK